MKRKEFEPLELSDMLMKINGEIEPVGETYEDGKRYFNLKRLLKTMNIFLDEIAYVCDCADDNDYSVKRSGDEAVKWMKGLHKWIGNSYATDEQEQKSNDKLLEIADLVEGDIGHFERDDAMDLLYDIKRVLKE